MPVKELVLEPGVNVGAKTVTKSRTRKTKSAKSGVKASKADKVSNVPAQFVLPKIETHYWFCFYTGLILVITLLSTCIFSNHGSPSSSYESAGFFSYLFSVIAPGALSLFSFISGGVVLFPSRLLFFIIFIVHAVASILVLISTSNRAEVPEHPVAVVAYLWSLLSAFVIVIGLILALTQMPVSRKKRR